MNEYMKLEEWKTNYDMFVMGSGESVLDFGWYDWHCSNITLYERTCDIATMLMKITNPELMDCEVILKEYNDTYYEGGGHVRIYAYLKRGNERVVCIERLFKYDANGSKTLTWSVYAEGANACEELIFEDALKIVQGL